MCRSTQAVKMQVAARLQSDTLHTGHNSQCVPLQLTTWHPGMTSYLCLEKIVTCDIRSVPGLLHGC